MGRVLHWPKCQSDHFVWWRQHRLLTLCLMLRELHGSGNDRHVREVCSHSLVQQVVSRHFPLLQRGRSGGAGQLLLRLHLPVRPQRWPGQRAEGSVWGEEGRGEQQKLQEVMNVIHFEEYYHSHCSSNRMLAWFRAVSVCPCSLCCSHYVTLCHLVGSPEVSAVLTLHDWFGNASVHAIRLSISRRGRLLYFVSKRSFWIKNWRVKRRRTCVIVMCEWAAATTLPLCSPPPTQLDTLFTKSSVWFSDSKFLFTWYSSAQTQGLITDQNL